MKIKKLNAISPLADKIFSNYEYSDKVENPDGIMVRSAQMADYVVNENLLAVARAGAGTNNIPSADYAKKGIVVFNTPGANANAVKELVLCELFLGGRKIIDGIEWTKTIKDESNLSALVEKGKNVFVGGEIFGKTLGVVGLGAIGIAVANAAEELGMNVLGYDPYLSTERAVMLDRNVHLSTLEEIVEASDYITLHVPYMPTTKGMLNANNLKTAKKGVVIINNSRGELVDETAVIDALNSGVVAKYITDFPTKNLIETKNVICVPHLGASTPEAEDNCAIAAAKELKDYLENGNVVNSVNFPKATLARRTPGRVCVSYRAANGMLSKIGAAIYEEIVECASGQKDGIGYAIFNVAEVVTEQNVQDILAIDGVIRARSL